MNSLAVKKQMLAVKKTASSAVKKQMLAIHVFDIFLMALLKKCRA